MSFRKLLRVFSAGAEEPAAPRLKGNNAARGADAGRRFATIPAFSCDIKNRIPKIFKFNRHPHISYLTQIMQVKGVNVYVHWSIFFIAAIFLLGALQKPFLVLVGMACWVGIILIHECGHLLAAQRKRCRVHEIEIYLIVGITRFETPWSRVDHAFIAWGGVVAQAVVAIPCVAYLQVFGYSRFEVVNEALVLLGFFSLMIAAFNLLPVPPLDGATAWDLFPALYARMRDRQKRPPAPRYRSLR